MLIGYDPDAFVATSARTICPFHQQNPDIAAFAGCSCSLSLGSRPATPEEYQENRQRRLDQEKRLAEWYVS